MIRLDFEQGSEDWKYARLGIPTASQFHRIITKSGEKTKQWDTYASELLAAEMLDHDIDETESQFMTRGSDLENSAFKYYEFVRGVAPEKVGFVVRDDGLVGCSPDRFVGEDGGMECKILSAAKHVGRLIGFDALDVKAQIQGCMWITGRAWWDSLTFNPELPSSIVRMERDEKYIAKLAELVDAFILYLAQCRQELVLGDYITRESIEARAIKRRELGLPC